MFLLITYFIVSIGFSFLCSLLESVILSVSPAYIAVLLKNGKRSGPVLKKLKDEIDQPLAAILTLNTVAHTVGASGVGAQVLVVYGDSYLAAASAILTFVILVFSEIIPKTLGAIYWKKLAPSCAYLITWLIILLYPFVVMSRYIKQLFSNGPGKQVTREEMIVTAEIGANEGSIRHNESQVIRNLLMLDNITVSDIMTPRSVAFALPASSTVEQVLEKHKDIRFSRIPVYDDTLDKVTGLVLRFKIMEAASHDLDNLTLDKLKVPIHTVPEEISVTAALDQFIKRKEHLFLVVDEYGSTEGIVTLEDAIETLLGVEIVDEFDSVADMRAFALEQWRNKKSKERSSKGS